MCRLFTNEKSAIKEKNIRFRQGMSLNEILEELPKLTEDEKRQLWNVLDRDLSRVELEEESQEFLAELDDRVEALDRGEKTYSIDEVKQHLDAAIEKQAPGSKE